MGVDPQRLMMVLFSFVIAITLHEFGHAAAAVACGDDTPRDRGRLTLNPIDHLDPLGTVILVISAATGMLFGWGKPVMVNPANFRRPWISNIMVSFAGPMMNLLQAAVLALLLRTNVLHLAVGSPFSELLIIAANLNIILFLFNMIPVPPLDGASILANILPEGPSRAYVLFMERFGTLALIGVAIGGGAIITMPLRFLSGFLLG